MTAYPPIDARRLESLFSGVSMRAFRHWLKLKGKKYSSANKEELIQLVLHLIKEGELSEEEFYEAWIGFEENGAKRILLFHSRVAFTDPEEFREHLQGLELTLDTLPVLARKRPEKPVLCYINWQETENGPRIQAKYAETHRDIVANKETRTFEEELRTVIVLIIQDVRTGLVQLKFDKLGDVHDHKSENGRSSKKQFINDYLTKAEQLLAVDNFRKLDLGSVMEWLSQPANQELFRLPREEVRTSYNTRLTFNSMNPSADIRVDPTHIASTEADRKNWIFEKLQGYWLPDPDRKHLQRELFMGINRSESKVWFAASCMPEEIEYAIRRVTTA